MYAVIILVMSFAYAGTLVSKSPAYSLKWGADRISYSDEVFSLELKKRKCSEQTFKSFSEKMKLFSTGEFMRHGDGEINFTFNGTRYHEPLNSKRRNQLLMLPQEIRRIKLEEKFACEKKKAI